MNGLRLKPIIVEWEDATSGLQEAKDISEVDHDLVTTYSCGFLVKKTKKGVTIATDCHSPKDEHYKDKVRILHSIPNVWIRSITYL